MADLGFWEKKSTGGGGSAPIGNLRVDVLFTTDNSGSMSAFQNWLFDPATAIALNDALVVNGIGAVDQDGLNTDNCNRIATSKYSEMLQLAYRDLVVAQVSQSITGVSVGNTNVQFTNGATNYTGYTVYAYNNRQYVNNFAPTSSNVSLSGDYIDFNNHKYGSGDRVVYNNGGGTSIGGLTSGTTYFVSRVNNNRFRLATTKANAIAGTGVVDLNTTEGSGSNHSFTGPFELILRETSGAGTTQNIPIGSSCSAGGTVDFRLAVWRAVCHRVFVAQRLSSCRPPFPSTSHPAAGAATTKHRRGAHHHHGRLLLTPCGATTTSWPTGNARLCVCSGAARHAPAFVHYRHRGRDESALPPVISFACSLLVALTLERAVPLKARWPLGGDKRASLLSRRRY